MKRIKILLAGVVVAMVLMLLVYEAFKWTVMRVFVDKDEALVVINKFGDALPADLIVVPADDNRYKGVQEEVRGPGRYFLDPVRFDYKVVPLVQIPAGDPTRWTWDSLGKIVNGNTVPMVGVVSLKQGKAPPAGQEVVPPGCRGIQRDVLTPGTYKLNPYLYDVKLEPAVIIPPGSVGVATRLVAEVGPVSSVPIAPEVAATPSTRPWLSARIATGPTQRGILPHVLQPGVYYLNPRMVKVTVVPVGYDQVTFEHEQDTAIRFTSSDAYRVDCDLTVVWGRDPADAPEIVANIGNVDQVEQYIITPAMKAACQNEGGKFTAKELIQGTTRSKFQDDLSAALERDVEGRNLHVLLALVRNVEVRDSTGNDQTMGLMATIQQANIEAEREMTNQQKTATAAVAADLQQAEKLVDVARETVASETNVKVAQALAEGQKQAAEIDADRDLKVATIQRQVAQLDAQRTEILGKANADVQRMKAESEARGAKLLVDAFGSAQAYNLYTFAQGFQPQDLRFIYAGPGTFWTDLKSVQDVGATRILQEGQEGAGAGKK